MGVLDKLSGLMGGESTTNPATVWGGQSPYLEDMYKQAADISQQQGGTQYSQQFQNPSFNAFQNLASGGAQTNLNPLNQLAQGGQFDQFMGQQNQALGGAIDAGLGQINRNFQRNIMPSINTGAAMSGTSGGSRQGIAQGIAASDANQQASDFVNQMQSQNFNQIQGRNLQATGAGLDNQLGAFGQLGNFAGQENQAQNAALGQAPALSNLGFGTQYGNLAGLSGVLGGPTVLSGGGSSTGGLGSSIGGMMQGGAQLGALAMMSDERVKDNITKVGKLDNGIDVYSYTYKGSAQTQIGVIAQEVEKVMPEAVTEVGGLKRVDYGQVVKDLQQPVLGA